MKVQGEFLILSPLEIISEISRFLKKDISIKHIGKNVKLESISKYKKCELILPNKIFIRGSVLGLLKGEMLQSRNSLSDFVFANSNPIAINLVLEFLRNLKINILDIRTCLEICCKDVDEVEKLKKDAIKFWKEKTGICIQKVKLRPEFKPRCIHGTLHLRISNKLLRAFLQILVNLGIEVAKSNKMFAIDFLRGLIAAEGNVNINPKTKCLRMVRISSKLESDRKDYKEILRCVGIEIFSKDMKSVSKEKANKLGWKSGRGGAVLINRFSNFVLLLENRIFALCPEKEKKFLDGFVQMKSTKNLLRFRKLPKRFSLKIMKEVFGLSSQPRDTKNHFLKLGFIRLVSGSGKSSDPFIFELTKRAKKVLREIENHMGLV